MTYTLKDAQAYAQNICERNSKDRLNDGWSDSQIAAENAAIYSYRVQLYLDAMAGNYQP